MGNGTDYECDFIPRIGELIVLSYGRGGQPVRNYSFRVKDVQYRLDNGREHQAAVLVEEETNPSIWPD